VREREGDGEREKMEKMNELHSLNAVSNIMKMS